MRVAFLLLDRGRTPLAEIMVRSVKRVMPGVEVVQLTDRTPPVDGVDVVIRKPMPYPWIAQYYLSHLQELEGETIILDTDTVVLKDPRVVFENEFDVALTRRKGPILVDGKDIVPEQPYNGGVMFSRNHEFWKDCFDHSWTLSDELKNWFGLQMSLKVIADSGKYRVKELTCDEFNYSPSSSHEDLSHKYIAHYKGQTRKSWMFLKYWETA